MPLKRNSNTDEFNSILGQLNNELEAEGHLNLLSQVVHVEEFYKRVLNDLYGWNLKNSNEADGNAEAIDLIDEQNRLIFQVTVSCTTEKVNSTLGKSAMQQYSEDGYRLKFVFAGKQDAAIKSKRFTNKHGVRFQASNDILLTSDLVRTFMYMDVLQQEEVLHVAKQETGRSFLLTKELIEKRFENSKGVLGARYMPELTVPVDEMGYYRSEIRSTFASFARQ
jgi:hypothetical protein